MDGFPLIPRYQVGIDFCYLFCHEAKLRNGLGVQLFLVTGRHRLEREQGFTCLGHRLERSGGTITQLEDALKEQSAQVQIVNARLEADKATSGVFANDRHRPQP